MNNYNSSPTNNLSDKVIFTLIDQKNDRSIKIRESSIEYFSGLCVLFSCINYFLF